MEAPRYDMNWELAARSCPRFLPAPADGALGAGALRETAPGRSPYE